MCSTKLYKAQDTRQWLSTVTEKHGKVKYQQLDRDGSLSHSMASRSPMEVRRIWDQEQNNKCGEYNQREANPVAESIPNQQMGHASWWRSHYEFRGVAYKLWSKDQSQDHSESNTNQSVTNVKLITGHNLSANHLKSENFMFQLCKNILIKVTLTPGFLFPKTRLYFPLCPEDSKHLQKGKPSSLVRRRLPSKSFCAYEASPRSNRRKPRRGWGGGAVGWLYLTGSLNAGDDRGEGSRNVLPHCFTPSLPLLSLKFHSNESCTLSAWLCGCWYSYFLAMKKQWQER